MSVELPPSPEVEIFSTDHVAALEQCQMKAGTPWEYVLSMLDTYSAHEAVDALVMPLSSLVYLATREKTYKDMPPHEAFFIGCLIAMEAVRIAEGDDLLREMATQEHHLSLAVDSTATKEEMLAATAAEIAFLGTEGYERASEFHGLLRTWEPSVIGQDVIEYFRCGFGNIMQLIDVLTLVRQMENMSAVAENAMDLDEEIRTFLGEQG